MQLQLPSAFEGLFTPKRYKVYYGGRGGAKSWAIAIALLVIGMQRKIQVLCARELQVSISDSVHKLLSNVIAANPGFQAFYEVQNKLIIGKNGTEFVFKGLKHNINEIKSFEGADYCWVEEAQAVSDRSWETLIPTIRKENSEIWLCFNPKNPTDPTWERFVLKQDEDMIVKKVNWQDNPFFPEVLNKERLKLLKDDPEAYKHIWEGEFDTRYSGSIYAKYINLERFSDRVEHDPNFPVYTAWDKGYGDATAIVFFQVGAGEIFIIDYYEDNQEDVLFYCEVLAGKDIIVEERVLETGEVLKWRYGDDNEHSHRKAYNYHKHYGPHDMAIKVVEAGGRSFMAQAQKLGVNFEILPATTHVNSHQALRETLPKAWINKNRCSDLVQNLLNYHYEYDEDRQRYSKEPFHDWSSNGCDAAENMARVWRETAKPTTTKQIAKQKQEARFHSQRSQHGLVNQDPYRIKKI